ncbi:MAG: 50S ribosomal protein L25 [Planctomycetes bacterium]|nr:50S ribosomal protein L25 [Planctomycetota bacterium]
MTMTFVATPRTALGTRAARRQRAGGLVPITVSRRGAPSLHCTLPVDQAERLAREVRHLCALRIGDAQLTVLKSSVVRHCVEDYIQHIDLVQVEAASEVTVEVALRVRADDCPGVKAGGIVEQRMRSIRVRCRADAIPDAIDVDLSKQQLMTSLTVKELALPPGVKLATRPDLVVLSIVVPRWLKKAEGEAKAAAQSPTTAAATPAAAKPEAKPEAKGDSKAPAKK